MSPRAAASLVFALIVSSSAGAWPGPPATATAIAPGGVPTGVGRSLGSPTEGRLLGGAHLQESTCLRVCPAYATADVRWGLDHLVGLIDRAAHAVRRQYPDAVLNVGHLSRAGGGEIDHHRSHESGRDADIGFYVRSTAGKALMAPHFVAFRGDGTALSWPGAHFDDARNWALVAALLTDPKARIANIFVAAPLRARLLAHAEKIGAAHTLRLRAAEVMAQPRGALPHDDHFHVRIGCPPGMPGCVEYPTIARVRRHPRGAQPERLRARSASAPTTTITAAGAKRPSVQPARTAPKPKVPSSPTPEPLTPVQTSAESRPESPRELPEPRESREVTEEPPAFVPAPLDDVDGPLQEDETPPR